MTLKQRWKNWLKLHKIVKGFTALTGLEWLCIVAISVVFYVSGAPVWVAILPVYMTISVLYQGWKQGGMLSDDEKES